MDGYGLRDVGRCRRAHSLFPLLACPDIEVQGVFYRSAQATIKTAEVQCNCCSEKLDFAIGPMGERASLEKIAFKYK